MVAPTKKKAYEASQELGKSPVTWWSIDNNVKMMPKLTWLHEGGRDARNMIAVKEAPDSVQS